MKSVRMLNYSRSYKAPDNVEVGLTSTTVLAANSKRKYLLITHNGATSLPIYLAVGTAAIAAKGICLYSQGSTFEMIEGINLSTAAIYGITTSAAKYVTIQEAEDVANS